MYIPFEKKEGLTAKEFEKIFRETFVKDTLRKDGFKGSGFKFYKDVGDAYLFFQIIGSAKYGGFMEYFGVYFKGIDSCLGKEIEDPKKLTYHDMHFELNLYRYEIITENGNEIVKFDYGPNYSKNGVHKKYLALDYGKDESEAMKTIKIIEDLYKKEYKDFYENKDLSKENILNLELDDIQYYLNLWLEMWQEIALAEKEKSDKYGNGFPNLEIQDKHFKKIRQIEDNWFEKKEKSNYKLKTKYLKEMIGFRILLRFVYVSGDMDKFKRLLKMYKDYLGNEDGIRTINGKSKVMEEDYKKHPPWLYEENYKPIEK